MEDHREAVLVAPSLGPEAASPAVAILSERAATRALLCDVLKRGGIRAIVETESVDDAASLPPAAFQGLVVAIGSGRSQILEAFRGVRAMFPDTPLVGVWPDSEKSVARRALRAGVDGLIQESQIETALLPTVNAVCAGVVCFPRRTQPESTVATLTSREKQVLGMLVMGFGNAEIGQRLYLAESTVKSHLSSAYVKLGVGSRKDAAALILDPEEGLGTGILAISAA